MAHNKQCNHTITLHNHKVGISSNEITTLKLRTQ